jgi:hypothetical protein
MCPSCAGILQNNDQVIAAPKISYAESVEDIRNNSPDKALQLLENSSN